MLVVWMLVCLFVCVWYTCVHVHVVVHMYELACEDHRSTLPSSIIEELLSQLFEIVSHRMCGSLISPLMGQ